MLLRLADKHWDLAFSTCHEVPTPQTQVANARQDLFLAATDAAYSQFGGREASNEDEQVNGREQEELGAADRDWLDEFIGHGEDWLNRCVRQGEEGEGDDEGAGGTEPDACPKGGE